MKLNPLINKIHWPNTANRPNLAAPQLSKAGFNFSEILNLGSVGIEYSLGHNAPMIFIVAKTPNLVI